MFVVVDIDAVVVALAVIVSLAVIVDVAVATAGVVDGVIDAVVVITVLSPFPWLVL